MNSVEVKRLHNLTGHKDCIYTIERAGQSNLFFSGSGDGLIALWDLDKPEEGELVAKLEHSIYALHFHQDSGMLIAGHNYDGIHLLDWQNKKSSGSLHITQAAIFDIQSHGNRLFIGDGSGTLTVVDQQKLTVINQLKAGEKSLRTIAISASTAELAAGYSDNYIRVFDLETLALKFEWQAHANSVFTLRYTPDDSLLMSGSRDARLKVWDVRAGYIQAGEVVAHMHAINHIEFSPDNKHFVTCSLDKSIKVWDLEELRLLKVIDKGRHAGHGTSVNKLLWTDHRQQLVSASDDRTISVWDVRINNKGQVL